MSDIHYINTQEIRSNLVGFLKSLESGEEVAVLNRSKVIARLNRPNNAPKMTGGVKQLLDAADTIQHTTNVKSGSLGPTESYKDRYYKDMANKYGIS
jgi:antitoxin (DNA-binding transcriptional repressor) of toxin-antitoxin stability system